ncbi:probable WRKY transcription factor 11 [Malania oleifera]|uniref:probable WRKY transcription factor 11 n=1 Tax=Malania oleifera TaxID=397392 RepID=UPI0025AEB899|nr:probable WRKY transcription factor 11 [Malania oleifera]
MDHIDDHREGEESIPLIMRGCQMARELEESLQQLLLQQQQPINHPNLLLAITDQPQDLANSCHQIANMFGSARDKLMAITANAVHMHHHHHPALNVMEQPPPPLVIASHLHDHHHQQHTPFLRKLLSHNVDVRTTPRPQQLSQSCSAAASSSTATSRTSLKIFSSHQYPQSQDQESMDHNLALHNLQPPRESLAPMGMAHHQDHDPRDDHRQITTSSFGGGGSGADHVDKYASNSTKIRSSTSSSSSQSSRRRKDEAKKRVMNVPAPLIGNTQIPPDDGFTWRKYGQKEIYGSRFPRGYYRCTHQKLYQCPAKKQVQRLDDDPYTYEVTYRGEHTCHMSSTAPLARSQVMITTAHERHLTGGNIPLLAITSADSSFNAATTATSNHPVQLPILSSKSSNNNSNNSMINVSAPRPLGKSLSMGFISNFPSSSSSSTIACAGSSRNVSVNCTNFGIVGGAADYGGGRGSGRGSPSASVIQYDDNDKHHETYDEGIADLADAMFNSASNNNANISITDFIFPLASPSNSPKEHGGGSKN